MYHSSKTLTAPVFHPPHTHEQARYPSNYEASGSSNALWYSVNVGPAHIAFITSYADYDQDSAQVGLAFRAPISRLASGTLTFASDPVASHCGILCKGEWSAQVPG